MEQSNDEFEINLVELFYVLRSKLLLIILTAAIFGIGAGVYTHYFVTPMYSSSSSIMSFQSNLSFHIQILWWDHLLQVIILK